MARILVVDDEPPQVALMRLHLETSGHQVIEATTAAAALAAVASGTPEVVIADISMPGMDGFALLAAIRANSSTARLPVVFLTALDPAEVMPKAVSLGVSEVLAKPLRRDQFLGAVARCLGSVESGVRAPAASDSLLGATTALRLESLFARSAESAETQAIIEASVLFFDIRGFTRFAEQLGTAGTAELIETFFRAVAEHVAAHRGTIVKTLGDGALVLFQDDVATPELHAARALKAAFKIVLAARRTGEWLGERFPGMSLPEFSVGVGVHSGEAQLGQTTGPSGVEHTLIGDTVNIASRLEGQSKELGWSIVASDATAAAAGARYVCGERATVALKGREAPVVACEMIGLAPRADSTVQDWRVYRQFSDAVTHNSNAIRRLRAGSPART